MNLYLNFIKFKYLVFEESMVIQGIICLQLLKVEVIIQ